MEKALEKNGERLNASFHLITGQLKSSIPMWEDFTNKAAKLQTCLRTTVTAASAFLEALQNMADLASNTQGTTRDLGISLTRLCLRHRSIHAKMKNLTSSMVSLLVAPVTEKLDEWKKTVSQLEKDHHRDMKKAQAEVKKSMATFSRLQKKSKKDVREETLKQLAESRLDFQQKVENLEKVAKSGVRSAMVEERKRYSSLVHVIKPFVEEEISMLGDVIHLQEIMDELSRQTSTPAVVFPDEEEPYDGAVLPVQRDFTSPSPPRIHPKLHPSFSLTTDPQTTTCSKVETRHRENFSSEADVSLADERQLPTNHCSRVQVQRGHPGLRLVTRLRPHSVAMVHEGRRVHDPAVALQRSETCDGSSCRFEGSTSLPEEAMTRSLRLDLDDSRDDIFSSRFDDMISALSCLHEKEAREATETERSSPGLLRPNGHPRESSRLQYPPLTSPEDVTPTNENQERDFAEQFLSQLRRETYLQNTEVVDDVAVARGGGEEAAVRCVPSGINHSPKESII